MEFRHKHGPVAIHKDSRSGEGAISQGWALSLFQYLDDWLGYAQSKIEAQAGCDHLVRLCSHLGFLINYQKSELIPTQVFDFVGIHINLHLGKAFITQKNHATVLTVVKQMSKLD